LKLSSAYLNYQNDLEEFITLVYNRTLLDKNIFHSYKFLLNLLQQQLDTVN
jgi:hypothetical protein